MGDKPYIWVDNTGSQGAGNLYGAWSVEQRVDFFRNTANGQGGWENLGRLDNTPTNEWGVNIKVGICTEPSRLGHVYAVWGRTTINPGGPIQAIRFSKSLDFGESWSPESPVVGITSYSLSTPSDLTGKNMDPNSGPSMTVDSSGNIYVVWAQKSLETGKEDPEIYLLKSATEGDSGWSPETPMRVNQDELGYDQWHPWVAWDNCTNAIAVAYLDSRYGQSRVDTYLSVSYDGAESFSPDDEVKVSDMSWSGDLDISGGYDYIGLAAQDGIAYPVWSDDREADDGATLKVYVSPIYLWGVDQDSVSSSYLDNGDGTMTVTVDWTTNIAADSSDVLTLFSPSDSVYTSTPVSNAGILHQAELTVPYEPGYWKYLVSSSRCNCIQPRTSDIDSFLTPQVSISGSWPPSSGGSAYTCPAGDGFPFTTEIEFQCCVTYVDSSRLTVEALELNPPGIAFFPQGTPQPADSAATSENGFKTYAVEPQIGGCGSDTDSVSVYLDEVEIGRIWVPRMNSVDMNGNGGVDSGDVAVLSATFGLCDTVPNYDPCANLAGYEACINMQDLNHLSVHFGHSSGNPLFKLGAGATDLTKLDVEPGTPAGTVEVAVRVHGLNKSAAFGVVLRPPAGKLQSVQWIPEPEYSETTVVVDSVDSGGRRLSILALEVYPDASGETELGILRFSNVTSGFSLSDLPISYEDMTPYESGISAGRPAHVRPPKHTTALSANRPNPFNPHTTIHYSLASESHVRLVVYDVAGRLVRTLVNTVQILGSHEQVWDGRNDAGKSVESGIYIYQLTTNDFNEARKMVLLR